MEFKVMLNNVGKDLTGSDVKALVFLCSDLAGWKRLASVESASQLFSILEEEDLLTAEKPHLLPELLGAIQQPRLIRKYDLNQIPRNQRVISPFRRLLYTLSDNITDQDLKSLKFLLSQLLPRTQLEENITTLELFFYLERRDDLSETNLSLLEKLIKEICPVLISHIQQFKDQYETLSSCVAQETKGRSFSDSDVSKQIPPLEDTYGRSSCESFDELPSLAQPSTMCSSDLSVDAPGNVPGGDGLSQQMSLLSTGTSSCADSKEEREVSAHLQSSDNQTSSEKKPRGPQPSHTSDAAPKELETYPMNSEKRGVCLIVNNYDFSNSVELLSNREGTEVDEKSLERVFKWLGFDVEIHSDCTGAEMLSLVGRLGQRDHSQMDCVVCCFLSHGCEGGVYGVDGTLVNISELKEPFTGSRCSSLLDKPKLFFIQACQGTKTQRPVQIQADGPESDCVHSDASSAEHSIPSHADFIISKATVPDFVSFRDTQHGTWFIQSLCRNLIQLVPRQWDLLTILIQVNADVAKKSDFIKKVNQLPQPVKQMPQPDFSIRKRVIFPVPGGAPPSLTA